MISSSWFSNIIKKRELYALLIASAGVYLLFPGFFVLSIYPSAGGAIPTDALDPSYRIALSKARLDDLSWGKDFVFTYGPLSYLSLKLGWGANKLQLLFFDLFICLNFFMVFYRSFLAAKNPFVAVLLIAAVSLITPAYPGGGSSILLLGFLVYWAIQSISASKLMADLMQLLFLVLAFYIKFNSGIIVIVFFVVTILYRLCVLKENRLWLASYLVISTLVILFSAWLLNVSLAQYFKSGLELISGYNDVMFIDTDPAELKFAMLVWGLALLLFISSIAKGNGPHIKKLFVFFLFFGSLYVLHKQSFVRADLQHTVYFFTFLPLFILAANDFLLPGQNTLSAAISTVLVICCFYVSKRGTSFSGDLENRLSKSDYFRQFSAYNSTAGLNLDTGQNQLPARIKHLVGDHSVDVYPWNIHLLVENKLNYKGRPVCQSYTAYTPYLENLNFEFYNSDRAPSFQLYEYLTIDNRYPLFDEGKLNLTLLKNYSCADTFTFAERKILLLQKRRSSKIRFEKIKEYELSLTDSIVPEKDHYYCWFLESSLKGKLRSFLDHGAEISIAISLRNGETHSYRTSAKLLESGIFSDQFIGNTEDFYAEITAQNSMDSAHDIVSYKLEPALPGLFDETVKVIEYKITDQSNSRSFKRSASSVLLGSR